MASTTLCSVIAETIFIADPHAAQRSGSTPKMRLSIRAQLTREGEGPGSVRGIPPQPEEARWDANAQPQDSPEVPAGEAGSR